MGPPVALRVVEFAEIGSMLVPQSGNNNVKPDAAVGERLGILANPGGAFIQG